MSHKFSQFLGTFLCALAFIAAWCFSPCLGNAPIYMVGYLSCLLTTAVGIFLIGIEPVRIPGILMCASALYFGIHLPDRRTASGYLMPNLFCFLLFGAGLLFAGVTPIRVPGIALCAGALFSVMDLPEEESFEMRLSNYVLCLAMFGMGVFLALIAA